MKLKGLYRVNQVSSETDHGVLSRFPSIRWPFKVGEKKPETEVKESGARLPFQAEENELKTTSEGSRWRFPSLRWPFQAEEDEPKTARSEKFRWRFPSLNWLLILKNSGIKYNFP